MDANLIALIVGIIFGFGLALSGMLDPSVVRGFLDVTTTATGSWNPQLLLVMAGGLAVSLVAFPVILKRQRPVCAKEFNQATQKNIDLRLTSGAILFGIGWGLTGICPGPAVAGLAAGRPEILLFFISMLIGMATFLYCEKKSS